MDDRASFAMLSTSLVMMLGALVLTACSTNSMLGQSSNMQLASAPATHVPTEPSIISSKSATLSAINMNSQGNHITSKPSEQVLVTASYAYDCPNCAINSNNQIIVGLAGRSAQACIYDGANKGSGSASFELKTPAMPGTYEVRFRAAQAENCAMALKSWWAMGSAPGKESTLGTITVVKFKE